MPSNLAAAYGKAVESAQAIEAMGFDAISTSEHHFTYDGFCPSPLLPHGAIATGTKRLKMVTGAMLLPLHDPLRVAEDAATLDRISGGRMILGFGMGYRPLEFDALNSDKRTRGARLVEMIQFLQQALSKERVTFHGKYYHYDNITVRPRPVQRPHPPIWFLGGTTIKAGRRAGRAGLPYWLANSTYEHAEECVLAYREVGREAGFPPQVLKTAVFKDFCLARSVDEAKAMRQVLLDVFYDEHILGFGYLVGEDGEHLYNCPKNHPLYQRFIESIFIGTPEMAIREMQRYEMLGIDAIYIATNQKELFVKEVMPAFRG